MIDAKELDKAREFYTMPVGVNTQRLSANVVSSNTSLIGTTEYVKSKKVANGIIYFEPFKKKFTWSTYIFDNNFYRKGIKGLYLKGLILWDDGLQSQISTLDDIEIINNQIQLTYYYNDRNAVSAIIRVCQR